MKNIITEFSHSKCHGATHSHKLPTSDSPRVCRDDSRSKQYLLDLNGCKGCPAYGGECRPRATLEKGEVGEVEMNIGGVVTPQQRIISALS